MAKLCLNILCWDFGRLDGSFQGATFLSSGRFENTRSEKRRCPAVRLFLSWVLNEACRIFNLAAEGRQGKCKIVCEQVIGGCDQNNRLHLHCVWFSSTDQNGSGGKFEGLCFGYYMVAVFSGKGIIPRGTQMWLSPSRWCALLHLWAKLIKPSILGP